MTEVCVVGGGPAGLAAAIALARSGRETWLIERAVPPIDKACGEGLLPDGVKALARLGVNLSGAGRPLRGLRFLSNTGASVTGNFPQEEGLGIRRVALHQALIERAERLNIKLMWGVKKVRTKRGLVSFEGGSIPTKLIVGADGQASQIRDEAGLNGFVRESKRFGFRQHYRVHPWSNHVEVYWAKGFQIYVTPTAADQVGVALLSDHPHFRLDNALQMVPALLERLRGANTSTSERGSVSVTKRLRRVCGGGYALVGDASGSVDAITGEGLSLAFQQAHALVAALDEGEPMQYQRAHRRLSWKPLLTGALLRVMGSNELWQRLAFQQAVFSRLVATFC